VSTPRTPEEPEILPLGLGLATHRGVTFTLANDQEALRGERRGPQWHDFVCIAASGGPCSAVRTPTGRVVPGKPLFRNSITGTALSVLCTVIYSWSST
jgi:hypothetical protein